MEGSATSRLSPVALLCFFLSILCMKTCSGQEGDLEFIKTSCGVTLYPDLCFQSLSGYANSVHKSPIRLARVALIVTMGSVRLTSKTLRCLSKENATASPREAAAVADCVETIGDSMDELHQSLREMKHLFGPEFYHKLSDIQTWVSAALTDEDTCMDGFEGDAMNGNIKTIIWNCIQRAAHMTSNALALINKLSSAEPQAHLP